MAHTQDLRLIRVVERASNILLADLLETAPVRSMAASGLWYAFPSVRTPAASVRVVL